MDIFQINWVQQMHLLVPSAPQAPILSQGRALARCARRGRTTQTQHLPPSQLARRVLLAPTAPASVPRPAQRAWSAPRALTMTRLARHQLLHAQSALQERTTPTLGPLRVLLAKRVLRGRTTMMWGPSTRADARCGRCHRLHHSVAVH
jgi:hypothetical protein